jgi:hypothetical protein
MVTKSTWEKGKRDKKEKWKIRMEILRGLKKVKNIISFY